MQPAELNALGEAMGTLLAAGFLRERDFSEAAATSEPAVSRGLLMSVKRMIDENLANPSLSPPKVASRFGVSVRYIHKLFEREGETFGRYLLKQRLDVIRRDLIDLANTHRSIGDIAARWGIVDSASLHRNFRRLFGETPGRLRGTTRY